MDREEGTVRFIMQTMCNFRTKQLELNRRSISDNRIMYHETLSASYVFDLDKRLNVNITSRYSSEQGCTDSILARISS